MLIDGGILPVGSELACKNPDVRGILNGDGSLKVFFNGKEKILSFPSGAARFIENRSINGWIYWQVVTKDGNINLSEFRDKYIQANLKKG